MDGEANRNLSHKIFLPFSLICKTMNGSISISLMYLDYRLSRSTSSHTRPKSFCKCSDIIRPYHPLLDSNVFIDSGVLMTWMNFLLFKHQAVI